MAIWYGTAFNDIIYSDRGWSGYWETVYGKDGDDLIYGGWQNDNLNGGNGSDTIFGGFGNDLINDRPQFYCTDSARFCQIGRFPFVTFVVTTSTPKKISISARLACIKRQTCPPNAVEG